MSKEIFYTVRSVKRETEDSISISLQPSEPIVYKAGQYLTFIQEIGGEEVRRCYSLSSSPSGKEDPTITLKKVEGGKMSTWLLKNAASGLRINGYAPMGNFVIPSNTKKYHVYLGGGSGITPLYSMIRECFGKNIQQHLFYVNKDAASTIFKNELDADVMLHPDLRVSHHFTSMYGKPNISAIQNWLKSTGIAVSDANFFICGPEGLMKEVGEALAAVGVKPDAVFKESFFTSSSPEAVVGSTDKDYEVTIQFQKKTYQITVPKGKFILETALANKIRLPHSCQSGLCTACMGQCLQGQVSMVDPEGLSDNEIKKGCVLTCVGRPVSDGVIIKID